MLEFWNTLDRRWVFLAMALAVASPILLGIGATEQPTLQTQRMFDQIESLPEGSRILMALDYDPSSEAELTPMAYAFTRHCCLKRHKLYFLTLWPSGPPVVDKTISKIVQGEYGSGDRPMKYGEDYLNLGYFPGEFAAVNPICSNLRQAKSQDIQGVSLDQLPIMNGITGGKDMNLIINVSGGYPGAKEWVQYGSTPHNIPMGAGCTGVQATQLFPYYPDQLVGLVAAIRGAAEYEAVLAAQYPQYSDIKLRSGTRRMGAQQWAHRLMIGLILLGNAIHFASRRRKPPQPSPLPARPGRGDHKVAMKRETLIWTMLLAFGGVFLIVRAVGIERGVGQQHVVPHEIAGLPGETDGTIVEIDPKTIPLHDSRHHLLRRAISHRDAAREDEGAVFSLSRTIGVWIAALLTLCIFSYLYRDNVGYKLAEAVIVGVSAGYAMVVAFWDVLVAKFLVKLTPDVARYAFLPDTPVGRETKWLYLIPLILGLMVFARWLPRGKWLARWPLAFVVGTTAGLKLISFLDADFVNQIRSTILPLIVFASDQSGARSFDWKQSLQNIVLVASVLTSLTYFYFSVEHTGIVGRISRVGVWVLMITFGASFALTVMSRITLLTMRLEFLLNDWLGVSRG